MAHHLVFKAIKAGKLRQQPCEVCSAKTAYAHHNDYSKPLEVRWLCPLHHIQWHRANGVWDLRTQSFKPWIIRRAKVRRTPTYISLPPDVARRLEKAAKNEDLSQSAYMVQALKARFKKDGIE